MKDLTVIIPTLDAAATLSRTLATVAGVPVVVVDGGSTDATVSIAREHAAAVLASQPGRGVQLRTGAERTDSQWLMFLHADTILEAGWQAAVEDFTGAPANVERAGVFRFALDDPSPAARRLEFLVRWRGRTLALPYGDQGLLIHRRLYDAIGGYRPLPIMEDVDIIRRVGRRRLRFLEPRAFTSPIRWRREGWTLRSARNLLCLALYYAGLPPRHIAKVYGR